MGKDSQGGTEPFRMNVSERLLPEEKFDPAPSNPKGGDGLALGD